MREHRKFLSICVEDNLNIWGFKDGTSVIYQKMNLYRKVFNIITAKANTLLMCFESGDSEILVWDQKNEYITKLKVDKSDEHEDEITCCDTLPSMGLIVTGDKDGLVKIWNCKK